MSYKSNACSVFAFQACLHAAHVRVSVYLRDQLKAKNTGMEKALFLSHYQSAGEMKHRVWKNIIHVIIDKINKIKTLQNNCEKN